MVPQKVLRRPLRVNVVLKFFILLVREWLLLFENYCYGEHGTTLSSQNLWKGYNKHPTLTRYVSIWDINVMLAYISTEKLTALLLILREKQKEILLAINIDVRIHKDKIIILPNSSLKYTNWTNTYKPLYITILTGTQHVV